MDGNLTPFNTLDNPYPLPDGITNPPGSSQGLLTLIGQDAAANRRYYHSGYTQQWNFDVQQDLGRNMLLEVTYSGSAGVGLPAEQAVYARRLKEAGFPGWLLSDRRWCRSFARSGRTLSQRQAMPGQRSRKALVSFESPSSDPGQGQSERIVHEESLPVNLKLKRVNLNAT